MRRACIALLLLLPASALADGTSTDTLRYETPVEKAWLRALLEDSFFIALGFLDDLRAVTKWTKYDSRYEWNFFRDKLTGDGQAFDDNQLFTNFVGHPAKGTLYYISARSNRLSVLESFAFALVPTIVWEYIGEANQKASYNDLVVTPIAGVAIGESLTQLGNFFDRSAPTTVHRVLGAVIDSAKTIHDAIDGAKLDRSSPPWHRFIVRFESGTVAHETTSSATWGASFASRIVDLPDYDQQGRHSLGWNDGNVTSIDARIAGSHHGLLDGVASFRALPWGFYASDIALDRHGRAKGTSAWIGPAVVFEFAAHDYDLDSRQPLDRAAMVALGPSAEIVHRTGGARVEARLDATVGLAGVNAYAIDRWLSTHDPKELSSVLAQRGYSFSADVAIGPSLSLGIGRFEIGARARVDSYFGIQGADVLPGTRDVPRFDRRIDSAAWISWRVRGPLHVGAIASARERQGSLDDISKSRVQLAIAGSMEVRF